MVCSLPKRLVLYLVFILGLKNARWGLRNQRRTERQLYPRRVKKASQGGEAFCGSERSATEQEPASEELNWRSFPHCGVRLVRHSVPTSLRFAMRPCVLQ